MISTIHFHYQFAVNTDKISNVCAYNMLPFEYMPQLICSQFSPQTPLCFSLMSAVLSCKLF